MKKEKAIEIITRCAKLYNDNLVNRNFLFVFTPVNKDSKDIQYLESLFLPKHFLHLTGVHINREGNNRKSNSSDFYRMCLNGKLSPNKFELRRDGTTELKLNVLTDAMNIHKIPKMVGDFDNSKSTLVTDKIIGTIRICVGFVRDSNAKKFYVPNTVLQEDTKKMVYKPYARVLGIFSKDVKDKVYTSYTYLAKDITIDDIITNDELKNIISLNK